MTRRMFCFGSVTYPVPNWKRIVSHRTSYVDHNREDLKWLAQNPRFCTSFMPVGSPQFVDQNLFTGVQAMIPRSSLHSPQDHPQVQRRSDWESMHGGPMNLYQAELLEEGVALTPSGCTWLTWCAISRIGVTAVAGPPSPPLFVRREFLGPPSRISCAYVGCDYSSSYLY